MEGGHAPPRGVRHGPQHLLRPASLPGAAERRRLAGRDAAAHPARIPGAALRLQGRAGAVHIEERDGEDPRRKEVRTHGHAHGLPLERALRPLHARPSHDQAPQGSEQVAMARKAPRPPVRRTPKGARSAADSYRESYTWDSVAWATHCVDCYPGSCMYHIYLKDGKVAFEEVAGSAPAIFEGIPDKNPMGCQKGAAWSQTLYGQERVLHPLRRVGGRRSVTWDQFSWH